MTETRTLLLSQSYEPIKLISWRRAFTLLTLGKVEVVEEYDHQVRTCQVAFHMPAVVRLLRSFRRFRKPVKFSRVNIYARDSYRCQYCGTEAPVSDLTYDHVVPRAQGGRTTWDNIVACCFRCNRDKGARTPRQAGMRLRKQPTQPRWVPAWTIRVSTTSIPEAWRDYLYWTGKLQ
jgi:5-methylcytosine-specific restriction endonuclease McrA